MLYVLIPPSLMLSLFLKEQHRQEMLLKIKQEKYNKECRMCIKFSNEIRFFKELFPLGFALCPILVTWGECLHSALTLRGTWVQREKPHTLWYHISLENPFYTETSNWENDNSKKGLLKVSMSPLRSQVGRDGKSMETSRQPAICIHFSMKVV